MHGATGRMGARLQALLPEYPDLTLAAAVVGPGSPGLGRDAGEAVGQRPSGIPLRADFRGIRPDVVVDFSVASAVAARLPEWERLGAALLVCTTALSPSVRRRLDRLARRVPVLVASNTARGVNALFALAEEAGRLLPGWDAEIVETHHRGKKDAPSGTALTLAERFTRHVRRRIVCGRGEGGMRRSAEELTIHALRVGEVVGEHSLVLAGPGERLELAHATLSRDALARGALDAARFLAAARPGRYTMADVFGLR